MEVAVAHVLSIMFWEDFITVLDLARTGHRSASSCQKFWHWDVTAKKLEKRDCGHGPVPVHVLPLHGSDDGKCPGTGPSRFDGTLSPSWIWLELVIGPRTGAENFGVGMALSGNLRKGLRAHMEVLVVNVLVPSYHVLTGLYHCLGSGKDWSHFTALGLYNFIRGFGWAYKRGGAYIQVSL